MKSSSTRRAAALVAAGVVAGFSLPAFGQRTEIEACLANTLTVMTRSQGENTTARLDLQAVNRGSRCRLDVNASIAIVRAGRAVHVQGNPLSRRFSGVLAHGTTTVLRGDWSNWCGSRTGLDVTARVDSRSITESAGVIPQCLQRAQPSRLVHVT